MKQINPLSTDRPNQGELLRSHFENHFSLTQINRKTQEELVRWIQRASPFRNGADFHSQLAKAKIKGLKKNHRNAIEDSFLVGLTRRPFLAALGLGSLVSFGAGIQSREHEELEEIDSSSIFVRPLVAAVQQEQQTTGQAIARILSQTPTSERRNYWQRFLHALDMSNWIEAAAFLADVSFQAKITDLAAATPVSNLIQALRRLQIAWDYLLSTRSFWDEKYFVAYAFGKMPALATSNIAQSPLPDYDPIAESHASVIHGMAPLFHALEVLNQRFQNPGKTASGAQIRFTQGHNFSYAHTSHTLLHDELIPVGKRKLLINWDAHADLSEPFDNPRIPLEDSFNRLQAAATFSERVVVSSSMSIAGWILPLIYEGLLNSSSDVSEIIWVVPKESQLTSKNYMEPYGEYSFVVGDWELPPTIEEVEKSSTSKVGTWNVPGSVEIRRFSDKETLRSVNSRDIINNQRQCKLHIVDPDNVPRLIELIDGSDFVLSIDADFAGTREPGLSPRRGILPHYPLTGGKEETARHGQLIGQLAEFVRQTGQQIRSVSIANSPNFTVNEGTRRPVAKILQIVTGENSISQPGWITNEINRTPPRETAGGSDILSTLLVAGGISGLTMFASLLTRDWYRLRKVRSLLFTECEVKE